MFQCCCAPADQSTSIDLIPTSPAAPSTASNWDAAGAAQAEETSAKAPEPVEQKQPEEPPAAPTPVAEPPAAPPAAVVEQLPASVEFKITVDKPKADSPLGLMCEILGKSLMILAVEDGPVKVHNSSAKPEQQVSVGDFVVEVNGVTGDRGRLYDSMVKGKKLDLLIRRPVNFAVNIDKNGQTLGMELDYLTNGACLLITAVRAGPIVEWNKANPGKAVKADDRILMVNGKKGTSESLMDMLKSNQQLELGIARG